MRGRTPNTNAARPYENPTGSTNFLELFAIVLLPAALTNAFGRMTGRPRQGRVLYRVMVALVVGGRSYFPALALGPIIEHLAMRG